MWDEIKPFLNFNGQTVWSLGGGRHENLNQLVWIMILAIFLYIAYVYNEFFTYPNGIFSHLGRVDVDFFLSLLAMDK